MGSILQNIDTAISANDDTVCKLDALEQIVCYLAYCMNAHERDISQYWSYEAWIELPEHLLLKLEHYKLLKIDKIRNLDGNFTPKLRVSKSAYFSTRPSNLTTLDVWGYNVQSKQYGVTMTEEIKTAYYDFLNKDIKYRKERIKKFLYSIEDYIKNLHMDYFNQLATCC